MLIKINIAIEQGQCVRNWVKRFLQKLTNTNMGVIFLLLFISLSVAILFLVLFLMASKSGQYDDDYTPSVRILFDKTNKNHK